MLLNKNMQTVVIHYNYFIAPYYITDYSILMAYIQYDHYVIIHKEVF